MARAVATLVSLAREEEEILWHPFSCPPTSHQALSWILGFPSGSNDKESQIRQKGTNKSKLAGTSQVVQWLRIHLAMQGMLVGSLVGELRSKTTEPGSLCDLATEPACHREHPT